MVETASLRMSHDNPSSAAASGHHGSSSNVDAMARGVERPMPLTGGITPGRSFFCPHCGALYAVTHARSNELARGTARCVVCERAMDEWESNSVPTYKLVHRPEDA
jgi:hypothetical protein